MGSSYRLWGQCFMPPFELPVVARHPSRALAGGHITPLSAFTLPVCLCPDFPLKGTPAAMDEGPP